MQVRGRRERIAGSLGIRERPRVSMEAAARGHAPGPDRGRVGGRRSSGLRRRRAGDSSSSSPPGVCRGTRLSELAWLEPEGTLSFHTPGCGTVVATPVAHGNGAYAGADTANNDTCDGIDPACCHRPDRTEPPPSATGVLPEVHSLEPAATSIDNLSANGGYWISRAFPSPDNGATGVASPCATRLPQRDRGNEPDPKQFTLTVAPPYGPCSACGSAPTFHHERRCERRR